MSVVRMRRKDGVIIQDCDIYVGRKLTMGGWNLPASKWQNIYKVNEYGLSKALELYEKHVRETPELWNSLEELEGKVLGCWCIQKPKQGDPEVCHAQILMRLINEKKFQKV